MLVIHVIQRRILEAEVVQKRIHVVEVFCVDGNSVKVVLTRKKEHRFSRKNTHNRGRPDGKKGQMLSRRKNR
jgi:hypothetical protein